MLRAALAICVLIAVVPATASATFPGRNGKLTATVEGCANARHIVAIDLGTGVKRNLTAPCARAGNTAYHRDTWGPTWLPDGRRFLFAELVQRRTPVEATFRTANAVGLAKSTAFGMPFHLEAEPSLSPDGTRFVFVRRDGLFTIGLDGRDERQILRERTCFDAQGGVHPEECDHIQQPRWSPDGRYIAVLRSSGESGVDRHGIWVIEARTGRYLRRVSTRGQDFEWSPGSRHLVFATYGARSDDGKVKGGNLFMVGVDGRGLRRIVRRQDTAETQPVISPDGRWVAWISLRFGPGDLSFDIEPTVWRQRLSGGRAQRLATLPEPYVDESFFRSPTLSWQPLPKR
jgi:Dipeptidyl peptidase IV (DPP IV) N-terminal region/WD40-like Beta Propeller Repeat